MKIGAQPDADLDRVRVARDAIGPETALFVDANGAYSARQAIWFAERFADRNVTWFEEPVSSPSICTTTTKKLIEFGKKKVMEVMWAAGAKQVVQESRFAHLVGAARMGNDPSTSVVDKFGRTHDIPDLFLCDGSILPTQGSANPGLTIQAPAARTADDLIQRGDAIFSSNRRDLSEPRIRYDLSPPYTRFKGNPRIA